VIPRELILKGGDATIDYGACTMKRQSICGPGAVTGGLALSLLLGTILSPCTAHAQAKKVSRSVVYRNVTLEFDASLAKEYLAETIPAVPLENPTDKPDGVAPQHTLITLKDSYAAHLHRERSSPFAIPRIYVFPATDNQDPRFNEEYPTLRQAVSDLNTLLGRRAGASPESIPFLPWADERQLFIGRKKMVRFRDGRGVFFLTQYDQEAAPVTNASLVYTFQGLTDDNEWYVSAIFPVAAHGLPASGHGGGGEAFPAGYDEYIRQTTDRLNRLPSKDFTPGMALLEEIIRSLKVGPR